MRIECVCLTFVNQGEKSSQRKKTSLKWKHFMWIVGSPIFWCFVLTKWIHASVTQLRKLERDVVIAQKEVIWCDEKESVPCQKVMSSLLALVLFSQGTSFSGALFHAPRSCLPSAAPNELSGNQYVIVNWGDCLLLIVSYCCCGCSTFQALCCAWGLRTDLSRRLCQWSYLFIRKDGHWCYPMNMVILFFINTNRSSRDKSGCCSSEGLGSTLSRPDRRFHSLSSSTRVHDFHSTHTISMIRFVWLLRLMCWIVVFLSRSSPNAWAPMSPIVLPVKFHSCWRCFLSTIQSIKTSSSLMMSMRWIVVFLLMSSQNAFAPRSPNPLSVKCQRLNLCTTSSNKRSLSPFRWIHWIVVFLLRSSPNAWAPTSPAAFSVQASCVSYVFLM